MTDLREEVAPTSLDDLFAKDPRSLTDREIDAIIDAYRAARGRWLKAEEEAKTAGKKRTTLPKADRPKIEINLDDLEL